MTTPHSAYVRLVCEDVPPVALQILFYHHVNQLFKGNIRLPAKLLPRIARISAQVIHLSRVQQGRIGCHLIVVIQVYSLEIGVYQLPHRFTYTRCDNVVFWASACSIIHMGRT